MKENKKLESIATLSEEEMVNTKGGHTLPTLQFKIPDRFINGIPVPPYLVRINVLEQEVLVNANIARM